jgi:hypothetical protein
MTAKKRSPLYQWEQEMIDAYHDHQWHLVLEPLYEKFQDWKTGKASHLEIDEAIHETHRSCQKVYSLFSSKRDFLISVIQFNEEWFPEWVKDHPRPKD